MELTKERGELDMKRMHTENELRQSQHAKQSLGMEKGILQKDVASLQTQLADKSESLRQSWTDANTKVHAAKAATSIWHCPHKCNAAASGLHIRYIAYLA